MKLENYKTKTSMIYNSIRADIIQERLKPGERLVVSEIAKMYNVSSIPVREAFQVLLQDGFIATGPRGFSVTLLSEKDIQDAFDLRGALEQLGVTLAIEHMTEEDLAQLEEQLRQAQLCVDADDFSGYWNANRCWHLTIYRLADNKRLLDMIEALYQYSDRYPAYFTRREHVMKSLMEHNMILDACRQKRFALAGELMRVHTLDSCQRVLELFRQKEEQQAEIKQEDEERPEVKQ